MSTFFHETHKFGGTSLADASGFIQSASLLPEQQRVFISRHEILKRCIQLQTQDTIEF